MQPEQPTDLPHPGPLLERHGFRLRLRRHEWWDCLIHDGHRAYVGHGESPEEALQDALRVLVPSEQARRLFLEGLSSPGDTDAATEEPAPPPPTDVPDPDPVEPAPREDATPAAPSRAADSEEEVQACIEDLAALAEVIRQAYSELAELSPGLIRLWSLAWIAEARTAEDRFPVRQDVAEGVHQVARELQKIAADYWPGVVTALQRECVPLDAAALLELPPGSERLKDWAAVATATQEKLEELADTPGLDEDGWADQAALEPPPLKAPGLFTEVCARVEKLSGPLEMGRAERNWYPQWPPPEFLVSELVDLARKARWLRGRLFEPVRWGILVGRLRCLSERLPTLQSVLDPAFRPAQSWAAELGQDPQAKRRRRLRKQVLVEQARPPRPWDEPHFRNWLLRAFEVLDTPEIAPLLNDQADLLGSLASADMPDRRCRSRLTRLKKVLAEPLDPERSARVLAEAAQAAEQSDEDEEAVAEGADHPLLATVLAHTRGRRLLFVGNRVDPHLQRTLTESLKPSRLEWCDGKTRKVAAAAERVRAGNHDLVLSATGFMPHKTEHALRDACKHAGADYIRVYKGRLAACLRAIVRDLGLVVGA